MYVTILDECFRKYFLSFPECLTALRLRAKFTQQSKGKGGQSQLAGPKTERPTQQQPLPPRHQQDVHVSLPQPSEQSFEMTDEELVSELSKIETAMAQG